MWSRLQKLHQAWNIFGGTRKRIDNKRSRANSDDGERGQRPEYSNRLNKLFRISKSANCHFWWNWSKWGCITATIIDSEQQGSTNCRHFVIIFTSWLTRKYYVHQIDYQWRERLLQHSRGRNGASERDLARDTIHDYTNVLRTIPKSDT